MGKGGKKDPGVIREATVEIPRNDLSNIAYKGLIGLIEGDGSLGNVEVEQGDIDDARFFLALKEATGQGVDVIRIVVRP